MLLLSQKILTFLSVHSVHPVLILFSYKAYALGKKLLYAFINKIIKQTLWKQM